MKKIPKSIWILGFVSLLMDTSSEMIHSVLPLYIVGNLGASSLMLGMLEGLAESLTLIAKIFSGTLSDYIGKRKFLAGFGYSLSAVSKPLFPLSGSILSVGLARLMDRLGKGIRGAPRDALVSELAPENLLGACFGLRQSLDTVGAVLGPLIALIILQYFTGNITLVFWVACVPAVLSASLIILAVPESKSGSRRSDVKELFNFRKFHGPFWMIILLNFLLNMGRFSEGFLVLRISESGLNLAWVPIVLIVLNVAYTLISYPAGSLSDRFGRKALLIPGIVALTIANTILACTNNMYTVFIGVIIWGIHMGFSQGVMSAWVAGTVPKEKLGTGFGLLNLSSGISILISCLLAGFVWDVYGFMFTYLLGALISLSTLLVFFVVRERV